ncbi:uncharacterized protein LOC131863509 [Cryptomeria japonica]|uniref:uncharacterized protein LOC131863509 n=1 Tax=Cryptomeria japonica TaxID=3369 RepID=UPI0027DA9568|nr:uncharacterized protein LOC131863509 [Cryptomeria japonica]
MDLKGDFFTWTNKRAGNNLIQVRLDRALVPNVWVCNYLCSLYALSRIGSDHYPISYFVESVFRKRKFPFRFEKMWLSHPFLYDNIKKWWNISINGSTMFRVAKKFVEVKSNIRKWNKESFGNIFVNKATIQLDLKEIKDKIQVKGYLDDHLARENEILSKLHDINSKEEEFWKQRLTATWLVAGDRNMKFFHLSTMKHEASNRINHIIRDGILFDFEANISCEAVCYFSGLLSDDMRLRPEAQ